MPGYLQNWIPQVEGVSATNNLQEKIRIFKILLVLGVCLSKESQISPSLKLLK